MDGSTRTMYRDFDGKFISKAEYESLLGANRGEEEIEEVGIGQRTTKLTLVARSDNGFASPSKLTLKFVKADVIPYLDAIAELQQVIDRLRNRDFTEITIRSLSQNSPISVSLEGAAEATETIRDMVVPWRRQHATEMSQLETQEKLAQIETLKAEVLEKRAHAEKERTEARKLDVETNSGKIAVDVEKLRLENEQLRLQIQESRINLALRIVETLKPNLTDSQRLALALQLLEPLGVLTDSTLQIAEVSEHAQITQTGVAQLGAG